MDNLTLAELEDEVYKCADKVGFDRLKFNDNPVASIADVMQVVEQARLYWDKNDYGEPTYWKFTSLTQGGWYVQVIWEHHDGDIVLAEAEENTLSEAICKAFCQAM